MSIYHKHHIIPKHMGGTNDSSNLVEVTIEEHAAIHKQLWEILGYEEDRIAWKALSGQISMGEASKLAILMGAERGRKNRPTGLKRSEESKIKQSKAMKDKIPWNKGKKGLQIPWNKGKTNIYSDKTLQKMSKSKVGKKLPIEQKEKVLEPIQKKYFCNCGCNKEYNIGNLTQHRKRSI